VSTNQASQRDGISTTNSRSIANRICAQLSDIPVYQLCARYLESSALAKMSSCMLVRSCLPLTVSLTPLLATPLAFTTTLPVVASVGTALTIDVAPPTRNGRRYSSVECHRAAASRRSEVRLRVCHRRAHRDGHAASHSPAFLLLIVFPLFRLMLRLMFRLKDSWVGRPGFPVSAALAGLAGSRISAPKTGFCSFGML
jgi:hypothetical protein